MQTHNLEERNWIKFSGVFPVSTVDLENKRDSTEIAKVNRAKDVDVQGIPEMRAGKTQG